MRGRGLLQKDFRIRADLSLSLSRDDGQKASEPILFVSLLTGTPSFSNMAHPLSNAALLPVFVLSQALPLGLVLLAVLGVSDAMIVSGEAEVLRSVGVGELSV